MGREKKVAGRLLSERAPGQVEGGANSELESHAELRLERNAERLGEARGPEEVERLAEVGRPRRVLELSTEVRRVEDVEGLEEEAELTLLAPGEELRDADVQLREGVAAVVVQRQVVLVVNVGVDRVAVYGDSVAVDVAAAGGEDAGGPRRG